MQTSEEVESTRGVPTREQMEALMKNAAQYVAANNLPGVGLFLMVVGTTGYGVHTICAQGEDEAQTKVIEDAFDTTLTWCLNDIYERRKLEEKQEVEDARDDSRS